MQLIHHTDTEFIFKILKSKELKSNKLTGNINQGDGIYDSNSFIYFATTPLFLDVRTSVPVTLYFDSDILYNRNFYIANMHTSTPDETYRANKHGYYKTHYGRYTKNINSILQKLYNNSMNHKDKKKYFYIFQQIAIKNKVSLKYLTGIDFGCYTPSDTLLKFISKNYPDIEVKYSERLKN